MCQIGNPKYSLAVRRQKWWHYDMFCRWVEQDPKEILSSVYYCMEQTLHSFKDLKINPADIKGMFDNFIMY